MSFPGPPWLSWPPQSQPLPQSHSTKEIEHRLTVLEETTDGLEDGDARHKARLDLHERAILGIIAAIYVMAQERFPEIAAAIRGWLIP